MTSSSKSLTSKSKPSIYDPNHNPPNLTNSFIKKDEKDKNVLLIPVLKMSTELIIDNTQIGKLVGDIDK